LTRGKKCTHTDRSTDFASSSGFDLGPAEQENFKRWNDALKGKDYEKVAALYSSSDLSFLPTVSP
jgi:uncharacterized protein (TIGR02246 family)